MSAQHENLRSYRPELDAVRFCAFFLVFLHHILPRQPLPVSNHILRSILQPGIWHFLNLFALACANGLPLFFMLSAYLITSLLLEEKEHFAKINIRHFYIRRILRIWPLYFLGILMGTLWSLYHHDAVSLTQFPCFVFLSGNLFFLYHAWNANPFSPLWSISVEEQFYLFWPWMMRWFTRTRLVWVALFLILLANINLIYVASLPAFTERSFGCNTFVLFQMFSVGILMALFVGRSRQRNGAGFALILIGPLLWFTVYCFFNSLHYESLIISAGSLMMRYILIALGTACVLRGFLYIGPAPLPKWLPALGKISYGLYVFHMLAVEIIHLVFSRFLKIGVIWLQPILALALLILMAKLSYKFFEKPFLQLKARYETIHAKPV